MAQKNLSKKLSLKKMTVSRLDNLAAGNVKGGTLWLHTITSITQQTKFLSDGGRSCSDPTEVPVCPQPVN